MAFLRRWWWAILLALVLLVRAVLPSVLRTQIETRASEALHAKVHVGNVDLALLSGGVALDDVSVRGLDEPPEEAPLLAWKRFAVDLRWLPLFSKIIRFSTIELTEPQLAVDRLQSGEINLMALVPASDPNAPPAPEGQKSAWKFGVDYVGLFRGGIRFRDLLMPDSEPLALSLQAIELKDVALEPEVYGGPADIRFIIRLDEGVVRTRARFTPRSEGIAVDVTVEGSKLPVHRSRVYVPGVAWSDLTGLLSLGLHYRLETGGRNELTGKIGLDDLVVWTGGLDEPSLAWKSLGVELEKIDLVKHEARVKAVRLDGAVVPVRPRGPEFLPVMTAARAAQAAAKSAAAPAAPAPPPASAPPPVPAAPAVRAAPAAPPAPAAPAADEPPPAPWSWQVASLGVDESHLHLLSDKPTLDVGFDLDAAGLSGPKHEGSAVKLGATIGEGRLRVDGQLRIEPLGFAGSVTSAALDVPTLVDIVGAIPPGVLQVAKLDADLKVALGSSAPTAGDVTVSGTTGISDLWIAANDPKEFAAGAKRIDVGIGGVTVPGALAKEPAGGRVLTAAIDKVGVDALYARVTRTETGFVLPSFTNAPATQVPPPAPPSESSAPAKAAGPSPQVTIASFQAKGRVDAMDRTTKPFYWNALDPIEADLQDIRMPEGEIGAVNVHAVSSTKGTIDVKGALTKKSDLELVVKDLALMPFNPYVTGMSPYSISRGALFVTTKASIDGPKYDTMTYLTLSDFDLRSRSGQNVVLEQLGIPLTVALALMRDWKGNVDLTIPVSMDEKGTQIALGTIVTNALISAIVGTLTSPLKIIGAVLPRGGSGDQSLAPKPIVFPPGLAVLNDAGQEQVKQLAAFLAGRPGLGVRLGAPVTTKDVRALRELALLDKLGPRGGVLGTIRNVGARGRITDALTARAKGEEATLDADDTKALDGYLEDVPPPSPEAIAKLGEARIALVEKALRDDYGIGAGQIARATDTPAEPADVDPGVAVELGSAH